ncbi:MAG: TlpA family protein disulfide reductase [Pirellulales bacterium]|nr:TlpA family protein disulfide reductase [Pirellulales bacterium]
MSPALLTCLLAAAFGADPALEPGTLLVYRGSIAEMGRDGVPGEAQKNFDLSVLVAEHNQGGTRLDWLLDEQGRGQWPWIERFGVWELNERGEPAGAASGPALLYDRGDGTSIVPIAPLMADLPDGIEPGHTWGPATAPSTYRGEVELLGGRAREVALDNPYGRQRTTWIETSGPLVLAIKERVFMGMGVEYELALQLAGRETLNSATRDTTLATFKSLAELKQQLQLEPRQESVQWNAAQVSLLADNLPKLREAHGAGPLANLLRAAENDLANQTERVDDVAKLVREFTGTEVAPFDIPGLGHGGLTQADLRGKVTVLHFWDYRDEPLKEPYGQIGYLDFLYGQRRAQGVAVYGVAVDTRLGDEQLRGAATRSVRKLQEFMNLSYPLLLDAGALLKQFGDPRRAGAGLPLFVVVGRDGRVAHYHVGHYEVNRDQGLTELDTAVGAALAAGAAP